MYNLLLEKKNEYKSKLITEKKEFKKDIKFLLIKIKEKGKLI